MKLKKAAFFTMFFITLCGFVGATWAEDEEGADFLTGAKASDFIKSRGYLGFGGTSAVIDNATWFNGTAASTTVTATGFTEEDIIPSIDRNFGFAILAGYRTGPWAAEVTYWRSTHAATWTGGGSTFNTSAVLQSFDIDFKRYLFTELPTQPFINLGICFPWLWIENGSNLLDSNNNVVAVDDSTISGIGFDLGVGMEIYLDDHFSLVGSVRERWTGFDQTEGILKDPSSGYDIAGNSSNNAALPGNGLQFFVGTTVGFQ